jgi:hypothetical protein
MLSASQESAPRNLSPELPVSPLALLLASVPVVALFADLSMEMLVFGSC